MISGQSPTDIQRLKLCFLVVLVDVAVKIVIRTLAGFERVIFTNNLTVTFVKNYF